MSSSSDEARWSGCRSQICYCGAESTLAFLSALTFMQEVKEFPALVDDSNVVSGPPPRSATVQN